MTKKPPQDFPPYTCGTCDFCHFHPDDTKRVTLICWVNPPVFAGFDEDGDPGMVRGGVVGVTLPACQHFKPRSHA